MKRVFKAILCGLVFGMSAMITSAIAWDEPGFDSLSLALKKLKYSIIPQTTNTLTLGDATHKFSNIYATTLNWVGAQTNGIVYAGATGLLADTVALTSGRVPYATTDGRLTDSANLTYDANLLTITGDATVTDLLSFDEADWTGGNVIYVPVASGTALQTACTNAQAGDILELGAGTYALTSNNLTPGKALTIRGKGVDRTIISFTTGYYQPNASNIKFENLTLLKTGTASTSIVYCDSNGLTGIDFTNVKFDYTNTDASGNAMALSFYRPVAGTWKNVQIYAPMTAEKNMQGVVFLLTGVTGTSATLNIYDSHIYCSTTGTNKNANGLVGLGGATSGTQTVNMYGGSIITSEAGSGEGRAVTSTGGAYSVLNLYGVSLNGSEYDAIQATSGSLTLSNCTLANNTTSGSITYRTWTAWTPTLTWATGTPASVTTVARYTITDGICHFTFRTTSADSNGCTGLTVTLPKTPKDINTMHAVTSRQLNDATWLDPMGYIDMTDDTPANRLLTFHGFATVADGATVTVEVSGEYEI